MATKPGRPPTPATELAGASDGTVSIRISIPLAVAVAVDAYVATRPYSGRSALLASLAVSAWHDLRAASARKARRDEARAAAVERRRAAKAAKAAASNQT